MLHKEITGAILECSFEVSKELGSGFLESVYENSLKVALAQRGLNVRSQEKLTVRFRGENVGVFFADLVVEDVVLVELKSVSKVVGAHKAQVINYLKATGMKTGLLLNFGNPRLEFYRLFY